MSDSIDTTEKPSVNIFGVSQSGKVIIFLEAADQCSALLRAKGLGDVMEFSPSLPLSVYQVNQIIEGVPFIRDEYFRMMGFVR